MSPPLTAAGLLRVDLGSEAILSGRWDTSMTL